MPKIEQITANEILDSRGIPALEVTIKLDNGTIASASSPTDVSSPLNRDTRDGDPNRYQGNGMLQAVTTVEQIVQSKLQGMECTSQQAIDKLLLACMVSDSKRFGKNVLIAVSMAVTAVAAKAQNKQLFQYIQELLKRDTQVMNIPKPMCTLIDGSVHSTVSTEMQEFFIIPASFKSYHESLELGVMMHSAVKKLLLKENSSSLVAEKGGFSPVLSNNEDALSLLTQAAESINIRPGYDVYFGIDVQANDFYKDKHYKIKDRSMPLNTNELIAFYNELSKKYHVLCIADAIQTEDIEGWASLFTMLNQKCIIAGDNLITTDPLKLQIALQKKACNAIVIKPVQNGTVSETLAVAEMAKTAGLKIIVAAGVGETNDTFLADFSVAIAADYVTFGAPVRGERVAKYNRLLEIEKLLNKQ